MQGEIVHDGATGQAIVAATGTPVDTILEALQSGDSRDDVLRAHPGLTLEDIAAAVQFARVAVRRGVRYPTADELPRTGGMVVREAAAPYNAGASPRAALRSARRHRARLAYEVDLIDGICEGLRQIQGGQGIPLEEVAAHLRARFPG
jgi:uncharacterized protein (DUF433 family)